MSPEPDVTTANAVSRPGVPAMPLSLAIGHRFVVPLLLFALYFDLSILNPVNVGWLLQGDLGQHFLGWTAFRFDEWRWPIVMSDLIAYPEGVPLTATDSNPLVSIVLKPFSSILPTYFQYVGIWYLLCLVVSYNIVFNLLVYLTDRPWPAVFGTTMIVASSFYFRRLEHDTLMAHGLIFASLSVFIRPNSDHMALAKHTAILALAVGIHPYFVPMTFPIAGMDLLRRTHGRFVRTHNYVASGRLLVGGLCVFLLAIAVMAWLLGMFSLALSPLGIGIYTMDPLAWFNGNRSSLLLQGWAEAGGQYEGAQYLGLGGMIVIALAAGLWLVGRARLPQPLAQSIPWLIPAMIVLFLMALSPVVKVFGETIVNVDVADWPVVGFLFSRFRASGRLAWPVSYVLVLVSVTMLLSFKSRLVAPCLAGLVVLQLIDLSAISERTRSITEGPAQDADKTLRQGEWRRYVDGASRVHFSRGVSHGTYYDLAYWAFPQGKPINRFYYAQGLVTEDQRQAERAEHKAFRQGQLAGDVLYVLKAADLARVLMNEAVPLEQITDFDGYFVIGPHTVDGEAGFEIPVNVRLKPDNGSFPDLFENCNRDCALFLSVKDEASDNLPREFVDLVSRAGGDISNLAFRGSYAAIIKDGAVVEQAISDDTEVSLSGTFFGFDVDIVSGGLISTNDSSILIDGLEFSPDLRGLNIVRLEPEGITAINTFDTFVSPMHVQVP